MRPALLTRWAAAAALSLLAASMAPALAASGDEQTAVRVITVSGEGAASGVPTRAQLSGGVTSLAPTASAALAQNARKMTAVFDALKRMGVPKRAIQTSNFTVEPQYATGPRGETLQKITGYQVSNQVDVTLDDTDKLGPALDALVGAGANQIGSISYGIKDPSALQTTAREAAVADAMKKAQTLAHAAGVHVGGVVSIQESTAEMPRPLMRMASGYADEAAPAPPTPTAAGELSVTVSVTMIFELR